VDRREVDELRGHEAEQPEEQGLIEVHEAHIFALYKLLDESVGAVGLIEDANHVVQFCLEAFEHGGVDGVGTADRHRDVFAEFLVLLPEGSEVSVECVLGGTVAGNVDASLDDGHHGDHHCDVAAQQQGLQLANHDCGGEVVYVHHQAVLLVSEVPGRLGDHHACVVQQHVDRLVASQ
jgi:hypothetical protein